MGGLAAAAAGSDPLLPGLIEPSLNSAESASLSSADPPALLFRLRYSALYLPYRSGCYLWLPLLLVRRVLLILCAVLLLSQPGLQCLLFNALLFIMHQIHTSVRPYRSNTDNRLESGAIVALLMLSLVLTSQAEQTGGLPVGVQVVAGALLVGPMIVLAAACAQLSLRNPRVKKLFAACCGGSKAKQPSGEADQHSAHHELRRKPTGSADIGFSGVTTEAHYLPLHE